MPHSCVGNRVQILVNSICLRLQPGFEHTDVKVLENLHSEAVNCYSRHKENIVQRWRSNQFQGMVDFWQVADGKAKTHGSETGDHEGPCSSALDEGNLLCAEEVDNKCLGHQTLQKPDCGERCNRGVRSIVCFENVPGRTSSQQQARSGHALSRKVGRSKTSKIDSCKE